ncbi:MAG TPA: Xaa-Pro aminopeptidase [Nevskiaceae bacterium]|nr:Xaa-Pro aminopeptidase [Nevskiaceae bacterium]
MFGSEFFAANRERLRQLFTGTAPIVITANGLLQQAGGEAFPLHQDRSFWYLTGIDEPDIVLVMDKGREYLIVPGREDSREKFDGRIDPAVVTRRSGIKDILNEKEGWRQLEARLKKVQHVATLGATPKYIEVYGVYSNPARATLIRRLKKANPGIELLDLRPHVARMRMVKQPLELQAIQQAIDITAEALKEVMRPKQLAKYGHEYEIEADFFRGIRKRGAQGHAFPPIVASGPRTCTMHYFANNAPLASDELVLMDVGAQVEYYAADITRTVAVGSKPSRRQQQIHDAVLEAQEYAFALIKPGLLLGEYEKQMEQFVGEKLRELGLIKSIERDAVREFFPHRTSHFLGLDTHDAGDYDWPLEAGAVLAVEPGIYAPQEGIGVRIEDNVLVTPEGCTVLSSQLPRVL